MTLCQSFVEKIYLTHLQKQQKKTSNNEKTFFEKSLMSPPQNFDRCGFYKHQAFLHTDEKHNTVEVETDQVYATVPSKEYKNVYAFLDDPGMKPAFFKDYTFLIDRVSTPEDNL